MPATAAGTLLVPGFVEFIGFKAAAIGCAFRMRSNAMRSRRATFGDGDGRMREEARAHRRASDKGGRQHPDRRLPAGLPLSPLRNGRPRCFWPAFSAETAPTPMLGPRTKG